MSKPSRTNVAIRAVVSAAVGLLALAGCVRLDGDLSVHGTDSEAPDTVSGTMIVAVADEWAIAHGEDPAELSAAMADELAANPESGLTGEPYAADGYTGSTLTFDEVPIERLGIATDGALSITHEGADYVVRGDFSSVDPGEGGTESAPWSARISVTLPEDVIDHNGTLDERTVTWNLDSASDDATIYATSSAGPVSWLSRVPVPLLVLTGLAGLGALLAWWLSRRKRGGDGGVLARQADSRRESTRKVDEIFDDER